MEHHFNIDYAKEYGIVDAVLINHFQFWLARNIANNTNFHDGRWWTYNTRQAIQELFPYLSYDQIRRALERLVDKGVLLTGNYNQKPSDRTLWYSLTDKFLPIMQNCQMQMAKLPNANGTDAKSLTYNKTDNITSVYNSDELHTSPNDSIVCSQEDIIAQKQKTFYRTLEAFIPTYGEDMITAFYDYWSEPNRSKTKLRHEMQVTWDIKKRLATWKRNEDNRKGFKNSDNRPFEERRKEFFESIRALLSEEEFRYDKAYLQAFYEYWVQKTNDGRMLWETKSAFELKRRVREYLSTRKKL